MDKGDDGTFCTSHRGGKGNDSRRQTNHIKTKDTVLCAAHVLHTTQWRRQPIKIEVISLLFNEKPVRETQCKSNVNVMMRPHLVQDRGVQHAVGGWGGGCTNQRARTVGQNSD